MKKHLFHLLLSGAVCLVSACGGSSNEATSVDAAGRHNEKLLESTGKDEDVGWFVAEVGSAGMFEVELGRLASSKATQPQVRQFGQLMLDHHTQSNAQLKEIANLKNLIVPNAMSDDHQEVYNKVMGNAGATFDKAYVEAIVEDHKEAIDKFEEMAEKGKDLELKAFAQKGLPTLRAHLLQAEKLEDELEKQQKLQ
ncbi:DUF4142 domain-containing protein [Rufibacter glacialis]|uniref:DUF4142 domain-containing protein n=1 Tax=Rufibacter glacialis TaxID=1259555 RepID=A0A5M8QE85_9BACT|nr:DUF4142 domain-containing protein [Rufibacter glacialis]KAA6433274.1 DUF4142 domain-containing protein [Rufibacter glacialis]GGK75952.1 hypothetical protein GCM10011405_24670 [Rufibacter glacialis]